LESLQNTQFVILNPVLAGGEESLFRRKSQKKQILRWRSGRHYVFSFVPYLYSLKPSYTFNYGEFAVIKMGVVNFLPDSKELNGISVSQPVGNEKISILGFQHVGQGDVIFLFHREDSASCSSYFDFFPYEIPFLNPSNSTGLKHKNRVNGPLPSLAYFDHFADVSKMILYSVSAIETGHFGLLDHSFKITPNVKR